MGVGKDPIIALMAMVILVFSFIAMITCEQNDTHTRKIKEFRSAAQECVNACPRGVKSLEVVYGSPKCECRE